MNSSVCVTIASISIRSASNLLAQARVLQQVGAQSHARDRRLEVVGHGRQQARSLVDEADEPALHGVEGVGGRRTSAGPSSGSGGRLMSRPSSSAAVGQHLQRTRDPAHRDEGQEQHRSEQDREGQQQPPRQAADCGLRQLACRRSPKSRRAAGPGSAEPARRVRAANAHAMPGPPIGPAPMGPGPRPSCAARGPRPSRRSGPVRGPRLDPNRPVVTQRGAQHRREHRGARPARRHRVIGGGARDPATLPAAARSACRRSARARPGSANPAA